MNKSHSTLFAMHPLPWILSISGEKLLLRTTYPFVKFGIKCGFPLAEEQNEAENLFLTHSWEYGFEYAGGLQVMLKVQFVYLFVCYTVDYMINL